MRDRGRSISSFETEEGPANEATFGAQIASEILWGIRAGWIIMLLRIRSVRGLRGSLFTCWRDVEGVSAERLAMDGELVQ